MQKEKVLFLEWLRSVCAITVVLDHVAISAIHYYEEGASALDKFIYSGIQHWTHFAVPVFLMISGYLLLDPLKPIDYKKAIGKYAKRMTVVLLTIGTAFTYMEIYFSSKTFCLTDVGNAVYLTLCGKTWDHLWYLYTMIGIYLILPALKPLFQCLSSRGIDTLLAILFCFDSLLPTIAHFSGFSVGVSLPMGSIFLFYFLLGGRLRTLCKPCCINSVIVLLMFLPFILAYFEYMHGKLSLLVLSGYSSPVIVAFAVSVFLFFHKLNMCAKPSQKPIGGGKIMQHISDNSFGIYIFHMLWVNLLYKVFRLNPLDYPLLILVPILVVVFLLSDLTTVVYKKIPVIGKFI